LLLVQHSLAELAVQPLMLLSNHEQQPSKAVATKAGTATKSLLSS
jgi:hypothetical protein